MKYILPPDVFTSPGYQVHVNFRERIGCGVKEVKCGNR